LPCLGEVLQYEPSAQINVGKPRLRGTKPCVADLI
jgi:hypothetical protein